MACSSRIIRQILHTESKIKIKMSWFTCLLHISSSLCHFILVFFIFSLRPHSSTRSLDLLLFTTRSHRCLFTAHRWLFWGLMIVREVSWSSGVNWIVLRCYCEKSQAASSVKADVFFLCVLGWNVRDWYAVSYPAHKQKALPQLLQRHDPGYISLTRRTCAAVSKVLFRLKSCQMAVKWRGVMLQLTISFPEWQFSNHSQAAVCMAGLSSFRFPHMKRRLVAV